MSPRFIRSLSVETDSTELADVTVLAAPSEPVASPPTTTLASASAPSRPFATLTSFTYLPSCLEPYISSEWVVLGAAVGIGCAIGAAIGSSNVVHEKLRRFKTRNC